MNISHMHPKEADYRDYVNVRLDELASCNLCGFFPCRWSTEGRKVYCYMCWEHELGMPKRKKSR